MTRGRKRTGVTKQCPVCKTEFYVRPSDSHRVCCSYKCRGEHQKKEGKLYKQWPYLNRTQLCDKIDEMGREIIAYRQEIDRLRTTYRDIPAGTHCAYCGDIYDKITMNTMCRTTGDKHGWVKPIKGVET